MKYSMLCSAVVAYTIFCYSHIYCKKNKDKKSLKTRTSTTTENAYDSSALLSEEWADYNSSNVSPLDIKYLITDVLNKYLDNDTLFLELASGDGEHITHFAQNFPYVTFQPTENEYDPNTDIPPHKVQYNLSNILEPTSLDVRSPSREWFGGILREESVNYIFVSNLVQAAPLKLATGIFEGAARYLKPAGYLFMYGPFKLQGQIFGEENIKLDRELRKKNYMWGLREVWGELNEEAFDVGIYLEMVYKLPNYYQILAWKKDELIQYHLDESKIPADQAVVENNYFDDDYGDVPYNETTTAYPIPTTSDDWLHANTLMADG